VQQDLPHAHSPFLADQPGGYFGLLTLDANANQPGYLQAIAMHLEGMVSSPGATNAERTLAGKLDRALAQTRNSLNQATPGCHQARKYPVGSIAEPCVDQTS